ncbi:MAG: Scr1 family TA system antitoxin-like transcriptional regulator [Actinomadura sp.]
MTGRPEHTRDPLIRAFGAILRTYRDAKKLSRAQLAEAVGCTEGWIEKMENGTKPSLASAIDFDTYFDIPEKVFQQMAEEIEDAGIHAAPPPGCQILPADTTHYAAFSGSFTVLGFADGVQPAAYIESFRQGNLIRDPRAVADCAVRYALIQGHSYHVDESRRVIKREMEKLKL